MTLATKITFDFGNIMLFSEKVELQQPLEKKALQQKRLDLNQIFFTTSFSLLQNLH